MRNTAGILILVALLTLSGCRKKSDGDQVDLSEPRKAALVFASALESGDIEKAKYASLAGGVEVELVELMAKTTYDLRRLLDISRAKYGDAGAAIMARHGPTDATAYLKEAEVEITGNTAKVVARNGVNSIPLKFVDGKNWKVDIGAMTAKDDILVAVSTLRAIDGAAKSIIAEIESDKLPTAEGARAAMEAAIASRLRPSPAATAPSTLRSTSQPST